MSILIVFFYFLTYPKIIRVAVIIKRGSKRKPKNNDSISTINDAINASMKININQFLKIFCILYLCMNN